MLRGGSMRRGACGWRSLPTSYPGGGPGRHTDAMCSLAPHPEKAKRAANMSGPREKVANHDHRRRTCRQYHPSVLC